MASAGDIFLKWVCPAAGATIATLLFCSPLKSILEVNRRRSLGETNALPYAVMLANAASWMFYGILIHDFFVYCGNITGVILGLYYTMICHKYSNDKGQDTLTYILMAASALFIVTGLVNMAAPLDHAASKTLWGSVSVAILVVFYSAPLATFAKVLRERNSSSLHWALCTMNTMNGALWFAYGLAIKDWFICVPNGAGAAFNVICVVMCFIFPRDAPSADEQRRPPQAGAEWQSSQLNGDDNKAGDAGHPGAIASKHTFLDLAQMRWRTPRGFKRADSIASAPSAGSLLGGELAAVYEGQDVEAGDQGQQQMAAGPGSASGPDGASSSGASGIAHSASSDDMPQLTPAGQARAR